LAFTRTGEKKAMARQIHHAGLLVTTILAGVAWAQHQSGSDVSNELPKIAVEAVIDDHTGHHETIEHHLEEHAEHAEHGEHGEHGEHEVSQAMVTTSYLLIGFLVTNFIMLWLVNYNDANVRSYTWKMMSSTISIYLAVVINASLESIVHWCANKATNMKEGSQEFTIVTAMTQILLFLGCYAGVNILCYKLRSNAQYMFATSTIGGHLTAFALHGALEAVLKTKLEDAYVWGLAFLIFGGLVGLRIVSHKLRERYGPAEVKRPGKPAKTEGTKEETSNLTEWTPDQAQAKWREMAIEAEDDASAIVQSFMITEVVMVSLFAGEAEEAMAKHTRADIFKMAAVESVCLLLLVVAEYAQKLAEKKVDKKTAEAGKIHERVVENGSATLAMTMSWLALIFFFWLSAECFKGIDEHFIQIISAGILTACSLIGIIVLDFFADKFQENAAEKKEHRKTIAAKKLSHMAGTFAGTVAGSFKSFASGSKKEEKPSSSSASQIPTEELATEFMDLGNLAKGIRAIISGIALSVGLAWEHAFHAATDTVIETNQTLHQYGILSKMLIAGASVALMAPVWLKFIVNMARKTVEDHETLMLCQKQQN